MTAPNYLLLTLFSLICALFTSMYFNVRACTCDHLVLPPSLPPSLHPSHGRIWDIECGASLRLLEGHDELVRCIRFDDRKIVSGAYDG